MLIAALLALLGVDLIAIVVLLAIVISRRRWVKRRSGAFPGAIRVTTGEIHGLTPKWKRGYFLWVRDILVWTRAPFFFRNELVPVDRLSSQRPAEPGEVKRLGDDPVVAEFDAEGGTVQVAAGAEYRDLLSGAAALP
jgi:hypothetical protein